MWDSVKKTVAFALLALWMLPYAAAQTEETLSPDFGMRLSAGVDKKIRKGLHLSVAEEFRLDNRFSSVDRLQTELGVSYKPNKHLKVAAGYAMINPFSATSDGFKNTRHRVMADAVGSLYAGDWKFSIRERLQLTHRTGDFNTWQYPRNALMLKSRLSVKYSLSKTWKPYAYVEMRHFLNAPVIAAAYDGMSYTSLTGSEAAGWFLEGFNGAYLNRLRGSLGVDIKLHKEHGLNVCVLADYIRDKKVDANASGTKLKSYVRESGFAGWISAGYEYSF